MKIFAPGAYMWENKGDAALVLSFLPWLRDQFRADEITLTSFKPDSDATHYGVPVLPMVTRPHTFMKRAAARVAGMSKPTRFLLTLWRIVSIHVCMWLLDRWASLYRRNPKFARRVAPSHIGEIADAIANSDAVISVPGGYLLAARPTDDWWLYHLPTFRLIKRLGKQLVLGPCSVGPFNGIQRAIARRALRSIDLFLLREDRSVAIVESLGVDSGRVVRTPDMAFRFIGNADSEDLNLFLESLPSGLPLVGVSVRSHHYPGHSAPEQMEELYLESVCDALERVAQHGEAFPVIVPQTTMDAPISEVLSKKLAQRKLAHQLAPASFAPDELQAIYRHFRLMVGTRMHANILALNVGTPVVGIAYEPKTLGILEDLGLADWGIRIDEVGDGRLVELVAKRWGLADESRDIAQRATAAARDRLDHVGSELADRVAVLVNR